MLLRVNRHNWQVSVWKILRNPTVEVVAAIVVVLLAAWLLVNSEVEARGHTNFPVAPVSYR
jgi:hypothetical protein